MKGHNLSKLFILVIALFLFSGCAKMQRLLTLKRISAEQRALSRDIEKNDDLFMSLLNIVKSDMMKDYSDEKSVVDNFGEPIFKKDVEYKGRIVKQWLYRYQTRYFDSDKVYMYFDDSGKLVDYRYVPYKE